MPVTSEVKQKIIGIVTLLIVFTILGSLFISGRPQNTALASYEAQAQIIFEDAKNQFEYIRNVTLPLNITLFVYTKQQAIERWGKASSDLSTSNILRQEAIYKSLFLIAENDNLSDALVNWISSWTAVSFGNEIYVIYENFWPWDMPTAEAVLIHELTHVWQSGLPSPDNYDVSRAYNALMEGDAVYMEEYYKAQYTNNNGSGRPISDDSHVLSDFLLLDSVYFGVSDAVAELHLFPYVKGREFVAAIIDNGGWDMLNQCYSSVCAPSSTAHILHFDKYLADDAASLVFVPTPVDDGWVRVSSSYGNPSDTFGEYFIYVMLGHWLDDNRVQEVAAGWCGDSFSYYEQANDDYLFVWNITWSSIQAASDFNRAFVDMLNLAEAD
ncbi:MAG: basic secretory family protein, partial [Nitrososphaerota archaeon]|nr:basic secretory family protein [Nitrososphaerota archaeon]